MVLLGIFEQHPITCRRSCEQLDCPCWERINGARIVLIIFVSLGVDFQDERGGSRSMLLSEPSNLSSWEESNPVRRLIIPVLDGDGEVGGATVIIEDVPLRGLPRLRPLEALMLELSLQLVDLRVSCRSLLASLTLRLVDGGNETLRDIHDGFRVLLVDVEDGGGSAGRDWWCRGGRSGASRSGGTGLVRRGDGVVRHLVALRVVIGAVKDLAEVGMFASMRGVKPGVLAEEEKDA
jgi:hypothetical protein